MGRAMGRRLKWPTAAASHRHGAASCPRLCQTWAATHRVCDGPAGRCQRRHNERMLSTEGLVLGFAAALGGGLLIGIERERRKGAGPRRAPAGVRSFALAALAGAGATALEQPLLIAAGALLISALAVVAYWRNRTGDPGVTTELALLVTYLLGGLAIEHPIVSAGGSVVVTMPLAETTGCSIASPPSR